MKPGIKELTLSDAKGHFIPSQIKTLLKKAEDGNGTIVRCYETDGKNTSVNLQGPNGIKNAAKVSIIEDQLNNHLLPIDRNKIKDLSIGKFVIETIKLNYKN